MPKKVIIENFDCIKDYAKCKMCAKWLVYKGTTSSLLYHLTKVHHIVIDKERTSQHPPTEACWEQDENDMNFENHEASLNNALKPVEAEKINNAIFKMIAEDMLPLSFTEKNGFKNFMSVAVPGFNIPGRKAVTSKICKLYYDVAHKLSIILNNATTVSITTDAWTSTAVESYVTVTVHFINDSWELKSYVLETFEHPENHTAENLRNSLERCIQKWNLEGKIKATVHDNARNITGAVRDSNYLGESVPCFAHTLQLAINAALRHVKPLIDKCIKIVGHFKHSSNEMVALSKKQKEFGLPEHKLEQCCKTRWNSTFKMLKRLIEQKLAISSVFQGSTSSGIYTYYSNHIYLLYCICYLLNVGHMYLSEEDWLEMKNLVPVLEAFDVATTLMSSESKVTLSMVRQLIFKIKQNFLQILPLDSDLIKKFKETVKNQLQVRFLEKTSSNVEPTCALLAQILGEFYKELQ